MKKMKLLVGVVAIAAVLGAMSIPMAAAQSLDGVWFKVKVQTKGHSVDKSTGVYGTRNLAITSYVQFHWNSINKWYLADVWNNTSKGWKKASPGPHFFPFPADAGTENFFNGIILFFAGPEWPVIGTLHAPLITHATDAHGKLQATWKGTGDVIFGSDTTQTKLYFGSFNIKGKNVDPGQLPFSPG